MVAFKNELTGKYLSAVSTRKKKYDDAVKQAWAWYREGISRKEGALGISADSARQILRDASLSRQDAEMFVRVLQDRGFVKSCIFAGDSDGLRLLDYLTEFWDWDKSPYVREKLRRQNSIHKRYVLESLGTVVKHWEPYFKEILLGDVSKDSLNRFADSVAALPVSYQRKNAILLAGFIPLRRAYKKEKIPADLTQGVVMFSGKKGKRKILAPDIVKEIFQLEWPDIRAKAANMLAAVTGLRAGEIQSLRVCDIGGDFLLVRPRGIILTATKPPKTMKTGRSSCLSRS